jgi:hypothetical protein
MMARRAAPTMILVAACAVSGEPAAPIPHANPAPGAPPSSSSTTFTPTVAAHPMVASSPPPSTAMQTPSQPASNPTPILATAADWVEYAVGNPSFRGRTTVKVGGDGAVDVGFDHNGKTDRYAGQLDAVELRGLRDTLTANDPRALKSARATGKPDEARIELTVGSGGHSAKVVMWDAEQWKMPPLRALVVSFNAIANKTSGGKVKY